MLAPEAALQIDVNGEAFVTTMRTPGDDEALALGLLYTEGVIRDSDVVVAFEATDDPVSGVVGRINAVVSEADLAKPVTGRRSAISTASCGVCGTREWKDLTLDGAPLAPPETTLNVSTALSMMKSMRAGQSIFDETGGSHCAAGFDANGERIALFEDIGRHNAVDKVVGALLQEKRLASCRYLTTSGRASYEIVAKAYHAGIPFVLAVSAPSSMAVEMAERFGITLLGYCRDDRVSVYTHPGRVAGAPAAIEDRS